jgi:ferredoxin-NADP reductase
MTEHQQDPAKESILARPLKLQLKLLGKNSHAGTDIVSFNFARRNEDNNQNQNHYYLNYKAGQYAIVDLGTKEDPEGPLRSFTTASSPTEEDFILISTRVRDTPFKKKLACLGVGTSVNITAPLGKFVLHEDYSKPAVFLSGGIGVTPFRSIIKYATNKQLPVKITMFDSNRNQDNILYKKEFDECADLDANLKIVYTLDVSDNDWKGERGYINQAMVTKYLNSNELDDSIYYICGPPVMLKAMQKLLQDDLHIPKQRIKIEEFTGY